ncbi:FAD-dependent oxidoreductase [uncultured Draconibacterium sp.]|uniref:FAD-dependent oxidoreductase n=1 Tax=uncultured Draconibacterium sp. TaxID=1573823 RepID=UPI0029C90A62|nr:FAD-dependent oxidoreductase [uncultured Draconibacterium sp.]
MKTKSLVPFFLSIIFLFFSCQSKQEESQTNTDIVIYGGTSAAVTAAVQLAKMNKSVVIVCPDKHLGGLTSSGLGFTDTGNKSVIGGLAREFYQRVYSHYQTKEAWLWEKREEYGNTGQGTPAIDGDKRTMWIFEPHVAEQVFEDFIRENNIRVFRDCWLDRENGVEKQNGKIVSITMLNGEKYTAKIFIDATYEGDLMAAAGINYHVGREANKVYNEQWNGIQTGVLHHGHHFGNMNISPYVVPGDPASGVVPRISPEDPGKKGNGDKRIQAYCFRTCLTKVPENRVPIEQPENYDPAQYELLVRVLNNGWRETFNKFDPIPNHKTDVNNHGPFSFDNIGMNYDYPEATYERRAEIIREHENYQKGLLYFYATDPRVPAEIQDEMQQWGLAKDEFRDNGNWPHQIYVREARRMIGEFVMTENEVLGKSEVPHSIGMGSYTMDSHNTQRYITPDGFVQNEGDIGVHPHQPYQIDMGSILPKQEECKNLLVPVAVSSSHIAFGSIRMEPVFMILGQSAAMIAAMSIEEETPIHELQYQEIKTKLETAGQVLKHEATE